MNCFTHISGKLHNLFKKNHVGIKFYDGKFKSKVSNIPKKLTKYTAIITNNI